MPSYARRVCSSRARCAVVSHRTHPPSPLRTQQVSRASSSRELESARRLLWDRPRFVRRTSDVRLSHAFVRPGLPRARWDGVPPGSRLPFRTADPVGAVGAGSRRAPAVPGMPGAERGQAAEWAASRIEFTPQAQTGRRVVPRAAGRRVEVSMYRCRAGERGHPCPGLMPSVVTFHILPDPTRGRRADRRPPA
jgi:hypothetical protein